MNVESTEIKYVYIMDFLNSDMKNSKNENGVENGKVPEDTTESDT